MRRIIYFLEIVITVIFAACEDEAVIRPYPRVLTETIGSISEDGVEVKGQIYDVQDYKVADHGFVYSSEVSGLTSVKENNEKVSLGVLKNDGTFSALLEDNLSENTLYWVRAYAKIEGRTIYGVPLSFQSKGGKGPIISGFKPENGDCGDTLEIYGQHFGSTEDKNQVFLNDIQVNQLFCSDTLLKVLVPFKLDKSSVSIKVSTLKKKTVCSKQFKLIDPVIDSMSVKEICSGDSWVLYGKNLNSVTGVSIGQYNSNIIIPGKTKITIKLEDNAVPGEYNISLIQVDKLINLKNKVKVVLPVIEKVTPTVVWTDSILTIRGKHLKGLNFTLAKNYPLNTIYSSDTLAKAKVVSCWGDNGNISSVFKGYNIVASQIVNWLYPKVDSLDKNVVCIGDTLTLIGSYFPVVNDVSLYIDDEYNKYCPQIFSRSKNRIQIGVPKYINVGNHTIGFDRRSVGKFEVSQIKIDNISKNVLYWGDSFFVGLSNLKKEYLNDLNVVLDNSGCNIIEKRDDGVLVNVGERGFISENPTLKVSCAELYSQLTGQIQCITPWKLEKDNYCISNNDNANFYQIPNTQTPYLIGNVPNKSLFILGSDDKFVNETKMPDSRFNWNLVMDGALYTERWKYDLVKRVFTPIASYPDFEKDNSDYDARSSSRLQCFVFSINNKAYVGNPKVFNVYDPVADKWEQRKNIPEEYTSNIAYGDCYSFSANDKGYVIIRNKFFEYNPVSDQWTYLYDLPFAKSEDLRLFSTQIKDKIVIGTSVVYYQDIDFWQFSIPDKEWTHMLQFPGFGRIMALSNDDNIVKVYYLTDWNGNTSLATFDFDKYELVKNHVSGK